MEALVGGYVVVVLVILAVIVAILWIFLPFAVFGIKDLARQMITEQKRTNAILVEVRDRIGK